MPIISLDTHQTIKMTMIYRQDIRFLEAFVYFGLIINLITTSMYIPGPSQRYLIDKCLQQLENTDDRLAFDYSLTAFDQQYFQFNLDYTTSMLPITIEVN